MSGVYKNKDGDFEITMKRDKETKGTFRYNDGGFPHSKILYFTKEECREMNLGDVIKVTVRS